MKIGVLIIYCDELVRYLEAVKKCFDGYDKINIIKEYFTKTAEEEVRNKGLKSMEDCDYVWIPDADEFILKKDQRKIIDAVKDKKYDVVMCRIIDYVKENAIASPKRKHTPIILVEPKKVFFYDKRCAYFSRPLYSDVNIYHFSCLYPKETIQWKLNELQKRNKKDYEDCLKVLNSKTEPLDIPNEIREYLKEDKC